MSPLDEKIALRVAEICCALENVALKKKQFDYGVGFLFPCPHCAPLQKRGSKKRNAVAALIPIKNQYSYLFKCQRKQHYHCMFDTNLEGFLKKWDSSLHKRYVFDRKYR